MRKAGIHLGAFLALTALALFFGDALFSIVPYGSAALWLNTDWSRFESFASLLSWTSPEGLWQPVSGFVFAAFAALAPDALWPTALVQLLLFAAAGYWVFLFAYALLRAGDAAFTAAMLFIIFPANHMFLFSFASLPVLIAFNLIAASAWLWPGPGAAFAGLRRVASVTLALLALAAHPIGLGAPLAVWAWGVARHGDIRHKRLATIGALVLFAAFQALYRLGPHADVCLSERGPAFLFLPPLNIHGITLIAMAIAVLGFGAVRLVIVSRRAGRLPELLAFAGFGLALLIGLFDIACPRDADPIIVRVVAGVAVGGYLHVVSRCERRFPTLLMLLFMGVWIGFATPQIREASKQWTHASEQATRIDGEMQRLKEQWTTGTHVIYDLPHASPLVEAPGPHALRGTDGARIESGGAFDSEGLKAILGTIGRKTHWLWRTPGRLARLDFEPTRHEGFRFEFRGCSGMLDVSRFELRREGGFVSDEKDFERWERVGLQPRGGGRFAFFKDEAALIAPEGRVPPFERTEAVYLNMRRTPQTGDGETCLIGFAARDSRSLKGYARREVWRAFPPELDWRISRYDTALELFRHHPILADITDGDAWQKADEALSATLSNLAGRSSQAYRMTFKTPTIIERVEIVARYSRNGPAAGQSARLFVRAGAHAEWLMLGGDLRLLGSGRDTHLVVTVAQRQLPIADMALVVPSDDGELALGRTTVFLPIELPPVRL